MSATADFFRGRIDQMFDPRRPLAVLGARMPWQEIGASLAGQFARRAHAGQRVEGMDRFGPSEQRVVAGVSKAGRPRLPMRPMTSLLHLKQALNGGGEALAERWSETAIWQVFSGMAYSVRLPALQGEPLNAFTPVQAHGMRRMIRRQRTIAGRLQLRRSLIAGARAFEGNLAVLCDAGYTIRCLLQVIHAKGLRACLRLLRAIRPMAVWAEQQLDGPPKHLALGSNLVICANRSPSWRDESIKQGRRS